MARAADVVRLLQALSLVVITVVGLVRFSGPLSTFDTWPSLTAELRVSQHVATPALQARLTCRPNRSDTKWFNDTDCSEFTSEEACRWHRVHNVWLASYPGSGNTWLRHLLQRSTGVYTGSVYRDLDLIKAGYLGEFVRDPARVLGVKVHAPVFGHPLPSPDNGTAVVVIRHPLWAILAHASWDSGGHSATDATDEELYSTLACANFSGLRHRLNEWATHTEYWFSTFPKGRRRFVRFEDLKERTEQTLLTEILPYFGVDVKNPGIIRNVRCELQNSTQPASTRRVRKRPFQFTAEALAIAEDLVGPLMRRFNYSLEGFDVREPTELKCCELPDADILLPLKGCEGMR